MCLTSPETFLVKGGQPYSRTLYVIRKINPSQSKECVQFFILKNISAGEQANINFFTASTMSCHGDDVLSCTG